MAFTSCGKFLVFYDNSCLCVSISRTLLDVPLKDRIPIRAQAAVAAEEETLCCVQTRTRPSCCLAPFVAPIDYFHFVGPCCFRASAPPAFFLSMNVSFGCQS